MWEEVAWIALGILVAVGGTAAWFVGSKAKLRQGIKMVREWLDVPEKILDGIAEDSEGGSKLTQTEKGQVKAEIAQAIKALDELLGKK